MSSKRCVAQIEKRRETRPSFYTTTSMPFCLAVFADVFVLDMLVQTPVIVCKLVTADPRLQDWPSSLAVRRPFLSTTCAFPSRRRHELRAQKCLNNRPHRSDDHPAEVIYKCDKQSTTLKWYRHGYVHRDNDKPAVVSDNKRSGDETARAIAITTSRPSSGATGCRSGTRTASCTAPTTSRQGSRETGCKSGTTRRASCTGITTCRRTCIADTQCWAQNGNVYRDNGKPARILEDGTQTWNNRDGFLHRPDGLPAIVHADGRKGWWTNGRCTRWCESDGQMHVVLWQS